MSPLQLQLRSPPETPFCASWQCPQGCGQHQPCPGPGPHCWASLSVDAQGLPCILEPSEVAELGLLCRGQCKIGVLLQRRGMGVSLCSQLPRGGGRPAAGEGGRMGEYWPHRCGCSRQQIPPSAMQQSRDGFRSCLELVAWGSSTASLPLQLGWGLPGPGIDEEKGGLVGQLGAWEQR